MENEEVYFNLLASFSNIENKLVIEKKWSWKKGRF